MSYAESHKAIKAYIDANYVELPDSQQAWDNVPFDPTLGLTYVVWSILPTVADRISIGTGGTNDLRRERGFIRARVLGAVDEMEGDVMVAADAVVDMLRNAVIAVAGGSRPVLVDEPGPPIKFGTNSQGFWEVEVQVPYQRDKRS